MSTAKDLPVFFVPTVTTPVVDLPADEAKHALRVLRLKTGDRVCLADGQGQRSVGILTPVSGKHARVEVLETEQTAAPAWKLHLACAPTKQNARLEWFFEKAVEVGLDAFTPIWCAHSERGVLKTERLERIAVAALKQSRQAYLTAVHPPTDLLDFLQQPRAGQRFMAHCREEAPRPLLREVIGPGQSVTVLIGPEGDFSPSEIEAAEAAGYQSISLGNSRLRTETAALMAAFTAQLINQ